jgi:hypothetical protein
VALQRALALRAAGEVGEVPAHEMADAARLVQWVVEQVT